MCGISGFNWKDEEKIAKMVKALAYRGPDAKGVFVDDHMSLGHNRLSIIDLTASANQPMYDNKRELIIVFNGEIYNFRDLKKELEGEYKFKTNGDTEVILAGYRKWGKEVVERLNGMFAFAIWDKRENSLFCARDHAGMKPFYYFYDGKKFIFASEMRALFAHDIPRKLNLEALNMYFRTLYTPAPLTLVENIFKLPPSHTLTLKGDNLVIEKKYGQDKPEKSEFSYDEAVKALRGKVLESVERHLISDVPLGVYLSGGIDSSTVLFATSRFKSDINTFSVGFDLFGSDEEAKFNHDFELAKRTAEHFGATHHKVIISAEEALNAFDDMAEHNSDPISNPTSIAMMLLAREARKDVTVVLTGNAGDELFGGYDRYRMALAAHYYSQLPAFLKSIGNLHPKVRKLDYGKEVDLFAQFMFEKDKKISRIFSQDIFRESKHAKKYFKDNFFSQAGGNVVEKLMESDEKLWLPDHFFMLSDKMSMASGLEERMPLADKELVSFARSLPLSYKLDLFRTKKILKDAFRDDLPSFLFDQPKRGWFSPAAKWLRNKEFSAFAREVLSEGYYAGTKSLFNWSSLRQMLEGHINKEEYNLILIWAAITFQTWAKKFKITL